MLARSLRLLRARVQDATFDAGFVLPFGIGDFVWADTNADGVQVRRRATAAAARYGGAQTDDG